MSGPVGDFNPVQFLSQMRTVGASFQQVGKLQGHDYVEISDGKGGIKKATFKEVTGMVQDALKEGSTFDRTEKKESLLFSPESLEYLKELDRRMS